MTALPLDDSIAEAFKKFSVDENERGFLIVIDNEKFVVPDAEKHGVSINTLPSSSDFEAESVAS